MANNIIYPLDTGINKTCFIDRIKSTKDKHIRKSLLGYRIDRKKTTFVHRLLNIYKR